MQTECDRTAKTAQALSTAARTYLERAKDAVHGDKIQLHDSPLFLTQVALDLVQCAAHKDTVMIWQSWLAAVSAAAWAFIKTKCI
jgi:hypothetical protein